MTDTAACLKVLVFGGKTGWIGQQMVALAEQKGFQVLSAESRLEDQAAVRAELDKVKPDLVLNCAGLTGRPNVDWCESHKQEVIRVNVIGTVSLVDECHQRNIHVTNFATGCIYEYDAVHTMDGPGFTEEDKPNFEGSFYSKTKILAEKLTREFPNVLILRVRMPISDDLSPRNFITKISHYERVVNVPNSMTVLHDLLPVALGMSVKRLTGIYNFTNPGVISHNEILDLYQQYIDPSFRYKNMSLEEQDKILKAGRSNNKLDCSKMVEAMPEFVIPDIKASMVKVFERLKANLAKK